MPDDPKDEDPTDEDQLAKFNLDIGPGVAPHLPPWTDPKLMYRHGLQERLLRLWRRKKDIFDLDKDEQGLPLAEERLLDESNFRLLQKINHQENQVMEALRKVWDGDAT